MSYIKAEDIKYEDFIKENKAVVIDFYADWCGPCKFFAPIFNEASEEFENVSFLKVDVDKNPDLAAQYRIRSIPTILFIKDGEVINTVIGAMPKYEFKETLTKLF